MQRLRLRLRRVCLTQRPPTLRPLVLTRTWNLTRAASLSRSVSFVPAGVLLRRAAARTGVAFPSARVGARPTRKRFRDAEKARSGSVPSPGALPGGGRGARPNRLRFAAGGAGEFIT